MSQGSDRLPDADGTARVPDRVDWIHLGLLIRERRAELGLTQREVHSFGGPSPATLYQLEAGRPGSYRPHILRRLERALGWGPGSVRRALAGQLPVLDSDGEPVAPPRPDRAARPAPQPYDRTGRPERPGAPDRRDRDGHTADQDGHADQDDHAADQDGRAWVAAFRDLPIAPQRKLALLAGLLQEMIAELDGSAGHRSRLDGRRVDGHGLDGQHLDGHGVDHDGRRLDGHGVDHDGRRSGNGATGNGGTGPGPGAGRSPLDRFGVFDPGRIRGLPPLDPRTGG